MEQFDLSLWLKEKSRKVVTRDGRPVRIVCWDKKDSEYPIVGLISRENGLKEKEGCCSFAMNGKAWGDTCYDLFFADEKEVNSIIDELKSYLEKTPKEQIEKDWKEIQDWYAQHFTNEKHNEKEELTEFEKEVAEAYEWAKTTEREDFVNEFAPKLLTLARKEIEKECRLCDKDDSNWEAGWNSCHKDLIQNLPKWKKANVFVSNEFGLATRDDDLIITQNGYQIKLSDLKTLPKEELIRKIKEQ